MIVLVLCLVTFAAACDRDTIPGQRGGAPPAPQTPTPPSTARLRIAAVGDAVCAAPAGPTPSTCRYAATSDLVVGDDIDAFLLLCDAQYPNGRYPDFLRYYGPTFGRVLNQTYPVLGNHEYEHPSGEPAGYYQYFGDRWRGPDGFGYYSFNLPKGCVPKDELCWHVIALSSQLCFGEPGCTQPLAGDSTPGERQFGWLSEDLESHPNADYPCTMAIFHHPLFHGDRVQEEVRPLWELMYSAGVDVVLNGHHHRYERWEQLTPSGVPDPELGIRQFVVGTGGSDLEALEAQPRELVAAQDQAFGVLEMDLAPGEYTWEWVPAAGQPQGFVDASSRPAACV